MGESMDTNIISIDKLTLGYYGRSVLESISLGIRPGEIVGVVGLNGSGKSTLIKALDRCLKPTCGNLYLKGKEFDKYSKKQFAKLVAYVPQFRPTPSISVRMLVEHGRYPYLGFGRKLNAEDKRKVDEAIRFTKLNEYENRLIETLSGGERQRAYLAMAIAQDTEVMLLDEPASSMDISGRLNMLDLLSSINREKGTAIIMIMHELGDALTFADRICLLHNKSLLAFQKPRELIESGLLETVFDVSIHPVNNGRAYWFERRKNTMTVKAY